MPEFKIEGDALRREVRFRMLSWGTVLLLTAVTVSLFVLNVSGVLSAHSNLSSLLFVFTGLGALIGACILACREVLNYAERQMTFVLDDNTIVRKRQGFPEVKITFHEIETLREELRWLIICSTEPRRKIAVPKDVKGYEVIRAELAKHHPLSAQAERPSKSIALPTISFLSWATVLWFRDVRVVIPAAAVALVSLAIGSHRLWTLLHQGSKRTLLWVCLGSVWFAAILLIYLRVLQS